MRLEENIAVNCEYIKAGLRILGTRTLQHTGFFSVVCMQEFHRIAEGEAYYMSQLVSNAGIKMGLTMQSMWARRPEVLVSVLQSILRMQKQERRDHTSGNTGRSSMLESRLPSSSKYLGSSPHR